MVVMANSKADIRAVLAMMLSSCHGRIAYDFQAVSVLQTQR